MAEVRPGLGVVEVAEMAEPVVRLLRYKNQGGKRRRLEENEVEVVEEKKEEMLIAPLGPRALVGSLLRRVGRESVFANAYQRLIGAGRATGVNDRGRGRRYGLRSLTPVGPAGRGIQGIIGRGDRASGLRGRGRGGGG